MGDHVVVTHYPRSSRSGIDSHVVVEWEGGRVGDMVADAVVAVLLQVRRPREREGGEEREGEPETRQAASSCVGAVHRDLTFTGACPIRCSGSDKTFT